MKKLYVAMTHHRDIASIKLCIRNIDLIKKYVKCVLVEGVPYNMADDAVLGYYSSILRQYNKDLQLDEPLAPFKDLLTEAQYTSLKNGRMDFRTIDLLMADISKKERIPKRVMPYVCAYAWYAFMRAAHQKGLFLRGLEEKDYFPGLGSLMLNRDASIVQHCRDHVKEMGSCFALVGASHGVDMIEELKSDMEIQDSYFHIYCNSTVIKLSLPSIQLRNKLASHPEYLGKSNSTRLLIILDKKGPHKMRIFKKSLIKPIKKSATRFRLKISKKR